MKKNDASRKALRIIGSILVAIALWIYVDTVTSPEVTLKVKNVPVEFSGEDTTLADRGLMLLSGYDTTVDLVIKGPRNELRKLDRSKDSDRGQYQQYQGGRQPDPDLRGGVSGQHPQREADGWILPAFTASPSPWASWTARKYPFSAKLWARG